MAPTSMDVAAGLRKRLAETDPDLLRELIATMVQALMAAEVDGISGVGYGEISPERVNSRNGYRLWPWDTRAGSIEQHHYDSEVARMYRVRLGTESGRPEGRSQASGSAIGA